MKYDVAVIGGGPAGYVAAIKAAQIGAKVVLFEKDRLGGVCLNRGCIPTKTYLKTAEQMETIRRAKDRGIVNDPAVCVNMERVVAYKDQVVRQLSEGVGMLLRSWGIEVVYGQASLASPSSIACGGQIYQAASTILCTGSKAANLPIPGINSPNVLTSDGILALQEVPPMLAIIGGGVIGCEMAAAFSAFGSKVTVIEALDRLVPSMDEDISTALKKHLKKAGVSIFTGCKVERIEEEADGRSTLYFGGGQAVCANKILLCIGRKADTECLGALKEQIRLENGRIAVDAHLCTSLANIYAAGDVNGSLMLAHAAFKMGETAAINALGGHETCDLRNIPSCVYTLPEAAGVGLTEAEAKRRYGVENVATGRFPFAANGRALACGSPEGFVKVVISKRYGEILGAHIVGCNAAEMITEAAVLMACEVPADEAARITHPHPSFSEAFMEACADAFGESVHLPRRL